MRDLEKIKLVQDLTSNEPSGWKEKASFRKANRGWLKRSAAISLRILNELENRNMSQADLARALKVTPQQVSKLVKGQENLTLETIDQIEAVLGIDLFAPQKKETTNAFFVLYGNFKFSETMEFGHNFENKITNVRKLYNAKAEALKCYE